MNKNLYALLALFLLLSGGPALAQMVRWERALGGSSYSHGYDVHQTPDGGYIATGVTDAAGGGEVTDSTRGDYDAWLVKYSAAGIRQWDHRYGGTRYEEAWSVCTTLDGGYLVGGVSYWGAGGDYSTAARGQVDYWALKLDAQGTKQWEHRYGTDSTDVLQAAWQAADGGYMLAGYSLASTANGDKSEPSRGDSDMWVIKLDAQGNKQWDRTLGGQRDEAAFSGMATPDGGCLLVGDTGSPVSGEVTQAPIGALTANDFWVVKLDAQGIIQWDRRYGGTDWDTAFACCLAPGGGYVVAGYSASGIGGGHSQAGRGGRDYWVVKLSATGAQQWEVALGTVDDDYCTGIAALAGGGYVVAGYTAGGLSGDKTQASQGQTDAWLVGLSATGTTLWNYSHGGSGEELTALVSPTADGGVIVTGASNSPPSGTKLAARRSAMDLWLLKLTAGGVRQWDQASGGAADDYQQAILPAADGSLWLAGQTQGSNGTDRSFSPIDRGQPQFWVVQRDSLGSARWDTAFDCNHTYRLRSLLITADQGLLAAGSRYSGSPDWGSMPLDADFTAFKLDSHHRPQWTLELRGLADDWLAEAYQTSDQGFVMGGTSHSGMGADKSEASRGGADFWLVKLSRLQAKQWDHRYGGTGLDSLATVRQLPDGSYLLAGSTTSPVGGDVTEPSRGGADFWLLKISALGVLQWQRRYGGPGNDWLAAARPTPDGGFVLAGTTTSGIGGELTEASRGGRDLWVVKVDATGQLQWQHRYGGSGGELAATMEVDPGGGYIIGATTTSPVSGDVTEPSRGGADYWLLRLTATGAVGWDARLGGSGHDELTCLAPRRGYGYAVGGFSNSPGNSGEHQLPAKGGYDYWPLLLGARPIVLAAAQATPATSPALAAYPNPAHDYLHLTIPSGAGDSALLLNALGQEVRHYFFRGLTPMLDIRGLPKGLYFLRIAGQYQPKSELKLVID